MRLKQGIQPVPCKQEAVAECDSTAFPLRVGVPPPCTSKIVKFIGSKSGMAVSRGLGQRKQLLVIGQKVSVKQDELALEIC